MVYVSSFNHTAPSEIHTLSLHDALPISRCCCVSPASAHAVTAIGWPTGTRCCARRCGRPTPPDELRTSPFRRRHRLAQQRRSEEHTSELQSLRHLVCRLLLEKKKQHRSK